MRQLLRFVLRPVLLCCVGSAAAAPAEAAEGAAPVNYDEAQVPAYTLPELLVCQDGSAVGDVHVWETVRSAELLELFRQHVYGYSPPRRNDQWYEVESVDADALGGRAIRKAVRVHFGKDAAYGSMRFIVYLPRAPQHPTPVFVGMHLFKYEDDPPLPGAPLLLPPKPGEAAAAPPDDPALRDLPGEQTIFTILERGYGVASINAEEVAPDDAARYDANVIRRFRPAGKVGRQPAEWGAIGAWAWSLSRALDYFETDAAVDAGQVIAIGHSRMGKTALWASAQDSRFAMVVSNNSGCGGAALSKRVFGETVAHINNRFPHWFCENFRQYNDREDRLPVDQHGLIALSAPRPVYIASAQDDGWADPHGEFLAAQAAGAAYNLYQLEGVSGAWPPQLNRTCGGALGYHLRMGRHALADFDWLRYLDFADRHLKAGAAAESR